MAKRARILFVCGTGIATSTAAEYKCIQALEALGYSVTSSQCIAQAVTNKAATFDPHVIITTTKLKIVKEVLPNGRTLFFVDGIPGIPAFNGVPFLTTIGESELVQKIAEAIDNSEKR